MSAKVLSGDSLTSETCKKEFIFGQVIFEKLTNTAEFSFNLYVV